jgi:hypothetical protein
VLTNNVDGAILKKSGTEHHFNGAAQMISTETSTFYFSDADCDDTKQGILDRAVAAVNLELKRLKLDGKVYCMGINSHFGGGLSPIVVVELGSMSGFIPTQSYSVQALLNLLRRTSTADGFAAYLYPAEVDYAENMIDF